MKTIKEIQEFNRRKIICAINNMDKWSRVKDRKSPLLLNKVLQCLDMIEIWETELRMCEGVWLIGWKDGKEILELLCGKETLEEQSEECQRAIFNLLGGK